MNKCCFLLYMTFIIPAFFISCNSNETEKEETPNNNVATNNNKEQSDVISGRYNFNSGDTIIWKAKHNDDDDFVHIGTVAIKKGGAEIIENQLIFLIIQNLLSLLFYKY